MNIRVAIVEDDANVRLNLSLIIRSAPGHACVAACESTEEALRVLPSKRPDVVLMDLHLPGRNGIECVARLRTLIPGAQVIMLTVEEDAAWVLEALKAGATGYLVKHAPPDEILEAVAEVHRGGAPMSSHIARMLVMTFRDAQPGPPAVDLSGRERDTLRLLARGHRTKEIADELGIGVGTVNTHVRHIYEKLHVRSRAEAVARWLKG